MNSDIDGREAYVSGIQFVLNKLFCEIAAFGPSIFLSVAMIAAIDSRGFVSRRKSLWAPSLPLIFRLVQAPTKLLSPC